MNKKDNLKANKKKIEQNMVEAEDTTYLSQEGFDRLKQELEELHTHKRREIAERLEYAKSLGDLTENAEYQEAKEAQLSNEARIAHIEGILGCAVLISEKNSNSLTVNLGSTVMVKRENGDGVEKYTVVGSEEADPFSKKISNDSPLGKALLQKNKGEEITVYTPKGEVKYKIIDIL